MTAHRELYRAMELPVLQNKMFASQEAARACARGDIVLVEDLATGLVSNHAFRPELVTYDADYQNEQAVSAVFQQHLESVADRLESGFQGQTFVEVGCGKAHFLELLQARGFDVQGFDPTYEGSNPAVRRRNFAPDVGFRADGVILRHVLEHVVDPYAFLELIRDANGGGGQIYIEVPCFDWICAHRAWFDIFYEHVNYFRLADLERIFGTIYDAGHTFHGQYLYVIADLSTLIPPAVDPGGMSNFPSDFLRRIEAHAERIRRSPDQPTAIWGGASKGVIFALFMERAGAPIDLVIDINPAKQGKYLAATGLRVQPPEAARQLPRGADLFVMNGNYLDEIRRDTEDQFNYLQVDADVDV